MLILFIIVLGLMAAFSGLSGAYRVFYLALGVLGLVWWGLRVNFMKITIHEDISGSSGFAGTKLFLKIRIANPGCFPVFWGVLTKSFPETLGTGFEQALISVAPHGQTEVQLAFYPRRRGIYPVPETRLTFGDPFGFREIVLKSTPPDQIVIYPQILPVVGLELNRHFPLGQNRVVFGLHDDPCRPRGCRDYLPGDSIRKIHWPNFARTHSLKVKEWETTLMEEIAVFLNLAEEDYPVSDWSWLSELGIDLAASLVHSLFASKETVGFYSNGRIAGAGMESYFTLAPKHGYQQEKRILHFLAGTALNPPALFLPLVQEAYRQTAGSCLILITPQAGPEMVQQVKNLIRTGYHPVILWLKSRNEVLPFKELAAWKIPYYIVEKRRDHSAFFVRKSG
jgi:uncharacterized protein (DUF58 family)